DDGNIFGGLQFGRTYWQEDLRMGDWSHRYWSGLGMHANSGGYSWAKFLIPKGATAFTTMFGQAHDPLRADGSLCYAQVIGSVRINSDDGTALWTGNFN